MVKKSDAEKHEPKKGQSTHLKRTSTPRKSHTPEKHHTPEKPPEKSPEKHHATAKPPEKSPEKQPTPEKSPAKPSKKPAGIQSIPSMTEEQTQAYLQFSEACKEVYGKYSEGTIDTRVTQLKSSPALVAVVRFMVMLHDLLKVYGVMQFNKHVSPTLYKYLNAIQDQTGQQLPLARVLLDGIKTTKMELLSGVTVHPLPDFKEPEYKTMTKQTPDPVDPDDEGFEQQGTTDPIDPDDEGVEQQDTTGEEQESEESSPLLSQDPEQHLGPGGPAFDEEVQPQSGTPVDSPVNPPDSIDEEESEGEGSESREGDTPEVTGEDTPASIAGKTPGSMKEDTPPEESK